MASFNNWPASSLLCGFPPLAPFSLPRRGGGGKERVAGGAHRVRKVDSLSLFLTFWSDAETRIVRAVFCRPWWTKEPIEVALGCLNKLSNFLRRLVLPRRRLPLLPSGHRGDGRWEMLVVLSGRAAPSLAATISMCLFSTAPRWPWAGLPSTVLAEGRPFCAMANPAASQRLHRFNLQAVVPKGRPYSPAISAFFGALVPSGFVPGDMVLAVTGGGFDAFSVVRDMIAFYQIV